MKVNQYITDFYKQFDEDGRLATRHGSVEFLTTMRYIEKYLRPCARILEIGAGTGRYSHTLARMGYNVDAVELVQHNIDVFNNNTSSGEQVTVVCGNATELSGFADDTYDVTLLLGPMYHLFEVAEKRQAIAEAIRVTKPGGVIFVAYVISDGCLIDEGFRRNNINVSEYIKQGRIDCHTFAATPQSMDLFDLVRKEDIDEMMRSFPVRRLHYVATDGSALIIREVIDDMDDETFGIYLKYHFATCERLDMVGATCHALDIFIK